ncbi:MAG: hypothetical protein J5594_01645 [Elusimicrobiaceae bacterium]|nr:hypothetical protein [Elusimicrobiaceae bacterium]
MKKLLLALTILVGSVLPTMAQNNRVHFSSVVDDALETALTDYVQNRDLKSSTMTAIPLLLNKSDDTVWKSINDSTVKKIVNTSINQLRDTSFIEFLINQDMPESEFDRYIHFAQERMDKFDRIFKKLSSDDGESYEGFSMQEYETCEAILELFDQVKEEKMYEKASKVNANIEKILRDNTETKMQEINQKYSF